MDGIIYIIKLNSFINEMNQMKNLQKWEKNFTKNIITYGDKRKISKTKQDWVYE